MHAIWQLAEQHPGPLVDQGRDARTSVLVRRDGDRLLAVGLAQGLLDAGRGQRLQQDRQGWIAGGDAPPHDMIRTVQADRAAGGEPGPRPIVQLEVQGIDAPGRLQRFARQRRRVRTAMDVGQAAPGPYCRREHLETVEESNEGELLQAPLGQSQVPVRRHEGAVGPGEHPCDHVLPQRLLQEFLERGNRLPVPPGLDLAQAKMRGDPLDRIAQHRRVADGPVHVQPVVHVPEDDPRGVGDRPRQRLIDDDRLDLERGFPPMQVEERRFEAAAAGPGQVEKGDRGFGLHPVNWTKGAEPDQSISP